MWQDIDSIEASCVIYVDVGTLQRLEQCNISILTMTELGIATLTGHSLSSVTMYDPWDILRQTSADVLSIEGCTVYIPQTQHFSGRSP